MKDLHSKAKHLFDQYLGRVQSAISGSRDVDSFDVERDVRDHIEMALEGVPEPVSSNAMRHVLQRLGSPTSWSAAEDSNLDTRKSEDWCLAYVSFSLVLLAFALPAFLWVGLFGAFLCARASLCTDKPKEDSSHVRGWLRLPALIVIYVPLITVVFLWPALAVRLLADVTLEYSALASRVPAEVTALAERIGQIRLTSFDPIVSAKIAIRSAHYLIAPVGGWLILLGLFTRAWPRPVARLLRPFVREGSHRFASALLFSGLLICAFSLLHGLLKLAVGSNAIAALI